MKKQDGRATAADGRLVPWANWRPTAQRFYPAGPEDLKKEMPLDAWKTTTIFSANFDMAMLLALYMTRNLFSVMEKQSMETNRAKSMTSSRLHNSGDRRCG